MIAPSTDDGRVRLRLPRQDALAAERAVGPRSSTWPSRSEPITIGDLPGSLDAESRLVLVRRLDPRGFLVLADV